MIDDVVSRGAGGKKSKKGAIPASPNKRKHDRTFLTGTIQNEVPKKRQSNKDSGSRNENDRLPFQIKKKPDLQTQLNYARNGHAVIRQLLPTEPLVHLRSVLVQHCQKQELAAWRQKVQVAADKDPIFAAHLAASCQTVVDCQNELHRLLGVNGEIALPFLQYFNTWRTYSQVYDVAQVLAETAAVLMDIPTVRLYQDAVFWKRVGDGPTPWHTDARMAPFDTSHMATFWIPLQPVRHSGLIFCSKSHADFALPYWNAVVGATTTDDSPWNNLEERYNELPCVDYMPIAVGDVTVHSGWTLHCADASIDENRLALAVTFVDARAPIRSDALPGVNSSKGDGEDVWSYKDWVRRVPSGISNWNHPLAPILWPPSLRDKERRSVA